MHHAVYLGVLAASLALGSLARGSVPAAAATVDRNCDYAPPNMRVPLAGSALPGVAFDPATRVVRVVLHVVHGANLHDYYPYYLATPGHEPVRMTIDGPVSGEESARRFGTNRSDGDGDYWVLTGTLPATTSFAVYYDEVWTGKELSSNLPCSTAFRRVVTTKAEGTQLSSERDASGLLPLVPLLQPVSTETLTSIDLPRPSGVRVVDPAGPAPTIVNFRAAWFRPRAGADVTTTLETRRGFDIWLTRSDPAPADREYRYVMGRSDNRCEFVLERFTWYVGEAIAANETVRTRGVPQPDGSCIVSVDAGRGSIIALHINTSANGLIQIVDATR